MDRREKSGDLTNAMIAFGEGLQSRLWTSMPGIIQSFNAAQKTVTVQVALKALVTLPDYTEQWQAIPLLVDCPVVFPGGGGVTLTFPLAKGDECLMVFASRCIDAWWQNGCPLDGNGSPVIQQQVELRLHDLSDGFCIPGISSVPQVPANISTQYAEMRTVDGTAYMRLNPSTKQIDHVTTGTLNLKGGVVNITSTTGAVNVVAATNAAVSGATTTQIDGKSFLTHKHTGVVTGGGVSGAVQ